MSMNKTLPFPNILIAVMGATGTGKSTLIHTLTGDENIHIGHGQESQTDQVQLSTYFDFSNNCNVTLVDTPGFDDSRDGVTDTDILRKIIDFLQNSGGQRLNGLIYMHRISDPRMGAISKRNLRMFKQLCGDGALKNVCIATTNWDRITKEEGEKREPELREGPNLFKPLINEGAQLVRHDKGITSARSIINYLIHKDPTKLQIQAELDEGKTLEETEAGSVLKEEIKMLAKKLEAKLLALKEEMEEAAREKHAELLAELKEERQKGEAQRKQMELDLENLKAQAQSDKVKSEAKIRSLEDKIAADERQRQPLDLENLKAQTQSDNVKLEAKIRSLEDKITADEKQRQRNKDKALNKRMGVDNKVRVGQEPERNQAELVERKSPPGKPGRELRLDSLKQAKPDKDEHDVPLNKKKEAEEAPCAEQKSEGWISYVRSFFW